MAVPDDFNLRRLTGVAPDAVRQWHRCGAPRVSTNPLEEKKGIGRNKAAGTVSLCDGVGLRSLSDIDLSTATNDPLPSTSFSARKNPQRIPANTPSVFPGLRLRIWPHLLRLVTKAMADRLLGFGAAAVGVSSTRMVLAHSATRGSHLFTPYLRHSAIDFYAVPNFDDLDQSMVIVYGVDDAIITLSDARGARS